MHDADFVVCLPGQFAQLLNGGFMAGDGTTPNRRSIGKYLEQVVVAIHGTLLFLRVYACLNFRERAGTSDSIVTWPLSGWRERFDKHLLDTPLAQLNRRARVKCYDGVSPAAVS